MAFWTRLFGGRGAAGDEKSAEPLRHDLVMERARNELALKSSAHDQGWGLGSASWSVDLATGEIAFDAPDGRRTVAPVQLVGTLDTTQGTWMWGWDHPSAPEPIRRDAMRVRDYGAERGLHDLTTRVIPCDEATAWDFAALAAHLSGAQGAYRGPTGATLVFMTFGTVTMSAGDSKPEPAKDFGAGLEPADAPEALALVRRYHDEIHAIETAHNGLPKDERRARFGSAIDAMQPVYDRHWRRDDDYWRPCSVSSQPESDLALTSEWRTFSRGPDAWRVTYVRDIGIRLPRAFDVKRFPDGLRIVDALF